MRRWGEGPRTVEGSLIEIGEIAAAIPLNDEGTFRSAPAGRAEAPPFPIKGLGAGGCRGAWVGVTGSQDHHAVDRSCGMLTQVDRRG